MNGTNLEIIAGDLTAAAVRLQSAAAKLAEGTQQPERPKDPPFGYEFTGEFRHAKDEHFYWYGTAQYSQAGTALPAWILRPLPVRPAKPPEGFEFAEETKRQATKGEWYWSGNPIIEPMQWLLKQPTPDRFWILRKLPTITDVYGRDPTERNAPEGWDWLIEEFKPAFRRVRPGEEYLVPGPPRVLNRPLKSAGDDWPGPRLILRQRPTIRSVYGKDLADLKPPVQREFTGEFRPPTSSEEWLDPDGRTVWDARTVGAPNVPCLILRRKPKPRHWIFEETDEVRPVQYGDWFIDMTEGVRQWTSMGRSIAAYKILRLVEKPE